MNLQVETPSEQVTQLAKPEAKKCNHMIVIIILAFLTVFGFSFGGFELWQNLQGSDVIVPSVILSVDKGNALGKELFEQIQDVVVTGACGANVHPLYDVEYAPLGYNDISNYTKLEIIMNRIPKMTDLKEDGDEVIVSKEEMQEAYDSVFAYGENVSSLLDYKRNLEQEEEGHIYISNYDIVQVDDDNYAVSYMRRMLPECAQPRFYETYEYVGLSNTVDNRLINSEDGVDVAMIVLEKVVTDIMDESEEGKSDGYYGVLFMRGRGEEKYFWVGAYYLGNVIEL